MAIEFAYYAGGREPAFVKHTFLDKYLPILIAQVGRSYPAFVYVDGFAGPWASKSERFEDTSFGIALRHMTALKSTLAEQGCHVQMKAVLVEKDATAHSELLKLQTQFPVVEITPLKGLVEEHVSQIVALIPSSAFTFFLFDPKGFPDMAALSPLLGRANAEAMVNFMFDFANRFATTGLIPALEAWLEVTGVIDWQRQVASLSSADREVKLEELAREALRKSGNYRFAPSISVDRVKQDRTLYKLIYLSRHESGLEAFRSSERKALEAQATSRSSAKAAALEHKTGQASLFTGGSDAIPYDRSAQSIVSGEQSAVTQTYRLIAAAGATGIRWREIWPPILTDNVVTKSALGRRINALRKAGDILAPGWPNEKTQLPKDDQWLLAANHQTG